MVKVKRKTPDEVMRDRSSHIIYNTPIEVTYRLSLMDSENRAVQVDVDLKSLLDGANKLMAEYKALLEKEAEDKKAMEAHDQEVSNRLKATHEEKQAELLERECAECGNKWKGGTDECNDPLCASHIK